nr:unnamed protein product [Callosobruchus analis]
MLASSSDSNVSDSSSEDDISEDELLPEGDHVDSLSSSHVMILMDEFVRLYLEIRDYRDLRLPPSEFERVTDLLRSSPEFTLSARLKQDPGNTGSIVSFAHGSNRYLELQSSGRKNEIRLHYTSRLDNKVYVETFRYHLADERWHSVAISISGSQVELLVDCESLFKRLLKPGVPERNFTDPIQLWIGQRNNHFYHFKHGEVKCHPVECPELSCKHPVNKSGDCCQSCLNIDECAMEGGEVGHHCHSNTVCVNTVGSYRCDCPDGYEQVDKFGCAEVDEWIAAPSNLLLNQADRPEMVGSSSTVCSGGCLNGGVCRAPGVCACAAGYTGASCERDLDECATNAHRCANTSVCVNMVGWYYCSCKRGFASPPLDNNLGAKCIDINECEMNLHTCHPPAQCINTQGGFLCECPSTNQHCKLSCLFEGKEIAHGVAVAPKNDPCQTCTCDRGIMRCEEPKCDCSLITFTTVPSSKTNSSEGVIGPPASCCPQCDPRLACRHQELTGVVDCFETRCPPLHSCERPVRSPEDCCPHCEDSCAYASANNNAPRGCEFSAALCELGGCREGT